MKAKVVSMLVLIVKSIVKVIAKLFTQFLLLFSRNKTHFVFTAKYGFFDNSKYLFLYYVAQKSPCTWVACDEQCFNEVSALIKDSPNATVVKKNSLKLLVALTKAKYAFVSHSFADFGAIAVKTCPVVNLWHGIPIKKMGYDAQSDIDLFALNKTNPYQINDFLIASSPVTTSFLISCMQVPSTKVIPLGQPRNDYLFDNKNNTKLIRTLKLHYSLEVDAKIYLYAPTFRDKDNVSIGIYTHLINAFISYATEKDVLVLRLHPKEKALLNKMKLPCQVTLSLLTDVQEELLASDILISDYSSIIFDFSVLARPILLYTPDKDDYFANRSGSYFEYNEIFSECRQITPCELNTIWNENINIGNFKKLMSLHSLFACRNIFDRFN